MPSIKLEDLEEGLREAWEKLADTFSKRYPTCKAVVVCTHRSPEEQAELYHKGRMQKGDEWVVIEPRYVVTYKDGKKFKSKHNYYPARALDIEIYTPDGKKLWNTEISVGGRDNPWRWFRDNAPRYGLVNGGSWSSLHDWPHFECA